MPQEPKLTRSQLAQLGGLAAARSAGSSGMAVRGAKGGRATASRHGREHFIRAAHKRWGKLKGADAAKSGISGPQRLRVATSRQPDAEPVGLSPSEAAAEVDAK